jgi:predicted NAD/FAD-dependent oxidoreductase
MPVQAGGRFLAVAIEVRTMTHEVAIVGAGAAGAGVAFTLRDVDAEVTVYEKSQGVCGRAATRRKNGCLYDHGANYLRSTDERVADLVTETIDDEGLVDVDEPVWTFDEDGTIAEGREHDGYKWTYAEGIDELGERLFAAADATVEHGVRIVEPVRQRECWRLRDDRGHDFGRFDAVVLTPPAPQTADLLGNANWEHRLCRRLRESVAVVPYRTVISAVLHYPFELEWPYYALVNEDKEHAVGWVSREECKAGHVPDGESLLVVQMGPDWSVEHYDVQETKLTDAAAEHVATLVDDDDLAAPDWTDVQHWRYALPDDGVDGSALERAADHDLFFAGDWVAGEGRLHAALRSGLETGAQLRDEMV